MSFKSVNFTASKTLMALLVFSLAACSATSDSLSNLSGSSSSNQQLPVQARNQTINQQCVQNAMAVEHQASISHSTAQYLAAANALTTCIADLTIEKTSPEQQKNVMQLHAITTLNYIKGGDIAKAKQMLEHFQHKYPQQDLYFDDYTSFLDTATALLSSESLTTLQLASLNISRTLRDEIELKHYWLTH
ncbi:MAG: hypothetical protein OCD00_12825 [Colwellia sp.]